MIEFTYKHPGAGPQHLGYLPGFFTEGAGTAVEQVNHNYPFGGWQKFDGFNMREDGSLLYPGDPPMPVLAEAKLGDEVIRVYSHAWVAIVQKDGSFEVARLNS